MADATSEFLLEVRLEEVPARMLPGAAQEIATHVFEELMRCGVAPGVVDTPLTAQNRFPMPAMISAEEAADEILRGFARGAFEIHFPRRFTRGLKLVAMLPHRLRFWCIRRFTGA